MAGAKGFEPPTKVLETRMMPFHHAPINRAQGAGKLLLDFLVINVLLALFAEFLQFNLSFHFLGFVSEIIDCFTASALKFNVWFSFRCHIIFFILYLSRRGESDSRPLSYQESVLPLNYFGINTFLM